MKSDKFHAHLDGCVQCRNRPFDLCDIGARLLREAVTGEPTKPAAKADILPKESP